MGRIFWQFIGVLLLVGFVLTYWWLVAPVVAAVLAVKITPPQSVDAHDDYGVTVATDSTAAATVTPTAPCTSSASSGYAATNPPATTSPGVQEAKPKPKSCAASRDTSPARSTAPSKNPGPKPLPQHRSIWYQAPIT